MPSKGHAEKSQRQSEKRRLRNKIVKSRVKTNIRKLLTSVDGNAKDEAAKQFVEVASLLDRAVSKGIIQKNTAARKKRRLHKVLNSLK